ncbi:c-type cytochrome [Enterovirga sp. CN4-39]|uniref:c-type cytochrome n=1 Tax=Enterovirga sp. CN4-39 TaxID=3400910 RepID=UPI003C05069A
MAMDSVGGTHGGGRDPLLGNKIAGAVLGALLLAMGLNIFSEILYTPKKPAVPGYDLPAPEAGASAGGSDQQAQAEPLPVRLASADPAKGQASAKKCLACHVLEKGGPNKIGPGLFGVIGHPKGAHEGFNYSAALKAKGGEWTFDDLDHFLANPKGFVPGTIMAFAGISNPKERADLIRYLQTLSDSPVPLPAVEAAPAAEPAAAPGPSQTQQQPTPSMPGQRAEPAPAPLQANPQPAESQTQPGAQQQPSPTQPADPAQVTPPQTEQKPQ